MPRLSDDVIHRREARVAELTTADVLSIVGAVADVTGLVVFVVGVDQARTGDAIDVDSRHCDSL